ncbi:ZIP family metal transporter [Parvibium lacunae]|uniref:ZIP family metal transporter n=1 Tax=Parvibium lacunae TaxID=1888893 RepID=A0A368L6J5_9BURK|nr:ZIP family metal transporter [Parvibium lacunae]RCS59246.1 ZIP family metal transporter [Parvibium lacunae]
MIDTTLISILAATVLGGLVSMLAAAWLSFKLLSRMVQPMVSLSTGLLLALSLLHLLPEAFHLGSEQGQAEHTLFAVLLAGLLSFFLLEKLALLRHDHHFEGDGHAHHHGHDKANAGRSGVSILVGDSIHNFSDGLLIAASFLADPHLGWAVTLSVVMHEIPQEVGDFMVLLNAGFTRRRAFLYNGLASLASILGGLLGYWLIGSSEQWMPYTLILAASSFLYIAVADLIPQLQQQLSWRQSFNQVLLISVGIMMILLLGKVGEHAH